MMPISSRRDFFKSTCLQGVTALSALGSSRLSTNYVAVNNAIRVIRNRNGFSSTIQTVPSRRPSFLALDANRNFLFAVNEINDYLGLPAGSVECYRVLPGDGLLKLVSRVSLSLSATLPKHLAISPDRQFLVIPAYGGGSYNVLPVSPKGELGAATQIIKEIGRSIHPEKQTSAHPHSVAFHPSGKFVIGTDLGSDRINIFAFQDGRMNRIDKVAAVPGSGPAHLQISLDGSSVSVWHKLMPIVSTYRFQTNSGRLTQEV